MCEITESESLERRLDWLAAENAELKARISQVWERCRALEGITRQARGEYSEAKGEIHRLRAGTASLRVACEAAREFLTDAVAYGLARREKGRVLGLIRAALDGVDPPAGEGVAT
jgi:chromosome segregation ATPase